MLENDVVVAFPTEPDEFRQDQKTTNSKEVENKESIGIHIYLTHIHLTFTERFKKPQYAWRHLVRVAIFCWFFLTLKQKHLM